MAVDELRLLDCTPGVTYRVTRLEGGGEFRQRLQNLGLTEGCELVKLHRQPFRGPVTVRVQQTKLAVGHGMAARIFVRPAQ